MSFAAGASPATVDGDGHAHRTSPEAGFHTVRLVLAGAYSKASWSGTAATSASNGGIVVLTQGDGD